MECSTTLEPAYLNLPGWRCVPVYAFPLSPRTAPDLMQPVTPEAHNLLPTSIPQDPRQWSRQNVLSWLEWCVDNFALPSLDLEKFYMNGRGLCLLKKSDLCDRAPQCGDVLYNALQILLSSKESSGSNGLLSANVSNSLLQHLTQDRGGAPFPKGGWARSISSDFHSMGHVIHESEHARVAVSHPGLNGSGGGGSDADSTTAGSPPPPQLDEKAADEASGSPTRAASLRQLVQMSDTVTENSTDKINVRLLWDFLQQLLNDTRQRYTGCIVWKDKTRGIFKITDPHRLAALWGKQKNHLNMNFDKMSRALRYYYRVRILQKEPGERHCYRFLRHPNELRHCKQRSLLIKDSDTINTSTPEDSATTTESALDMSIKDEASQSGDTE